MDVTFRAEFEFSINITDSPLGDWEKTYGGMVKIKTFIKEFFNHPEAVLSYYGSQYLNQFINKSIAQWDVMAKQLNYQSDFSDLFIEIAKTCPADVAEFMVDIFKEDKTDMRQFVRREIERRILIDELRTSILMHVRFIKL